MSCEYCEDNKQLFKSEIDGDIGLEIVITRDEIEVNHCYKTLPFDLSELSGNFEINYCPKCGDRLYKDGCTGESKINQNVFVPIEDLENAKAEKYKYKRERDKLLGIAKEYRDMLDCPDGVKYSGKLKKRINSIEEAIEEVEGDNND